MAYAMILFGSLLITVAAGFPTAADVPVSQDAVQRLKRQRSDGGVQSLLTGFAYTERMLLSCVSPTILPEVSGVSKQNCTSRGVRVSSTYKLLIAALDKVLRVYDLQERFLNQDKQNASVEMRALQIVIDTLVNQTCSWIESLGVHYRGGSESFSCSSGTDSIAQIRKLYALISAYHFVAEATTSTMNFVPGVTQSLTGWLNRSGVLSELTTLFAGTDYEVHLTPRPCMSCI